MDKLTDFPQYRKLSNGKHFYKINSFKDFEEIQVLGKRFFKVKVHASQYPEMLRILDMLNFSEGYENSNAEEFDALITEI